MPGSWERGGEDLERRREMEEGRKRVGGKSRLTNHENYLKSEMIVSKAEDRQREQLQ